MAAHNAAFDQTAFRARNDDGSETTATWIDALDTDWTQSADEVFRLRFQVTQTTSNANANLTKQFKVKVSHNGGVFNDVGGQGTSVQPVRYADSSNLTDGASTTEQLAGVETSFVAGRIIESAPSDAVTYPEATRTDSEYEAVLEIVGANVSPDDTLVFRVYESDDTALAAYTVVPTATVDNGAPTVHDLTGTLSGTGTVSGDLVARRALDGTLAGTGSVSGNLTIVEEDGFDPADLTVNINGTTAELAWTASGTPGVADYQVFRRTPQTGAAFDPETDTPVATGITGTTHDDVGLDPGDYDWQIFGRIPA